MAYCRNCIRLPGRHLSQTIKTRNSLYKYVCPKCNIISSPQVNIEQLMIIEMKYLRLYLINKKFSIVSCRVKKELAEMIVRVNNTHNSTSSSNNIDQNANNSSSNITNNTTVPVINTSQSVPNNISHIEVNIGDIILPTRNLQLNEIILDRVNNNNNNNLQPSTSIFSVVSPKSKRRTSLSNIDSIEKLESLSVKQIKEILAANFVHYKGCYEKNELIEKLKNLYSSYEKNKRIESLLNEREKNEILDPTKRATSVTNLNLNEYDLCKICMDRVIDCVLLECGHMVSCVKCGKKLAECPICRDNILRVIRVFRS